MANSRFMEPDELERWFQDKDAQLSVLAVSAPACWGWQIRIDEAGRYVPEEEFDRILATPHDRNLYFAMCAVHDDSQMFDVEEVAWALGNDQELDALADDYVSSEGCTVFGTEYWPDDFSHEELVELARYSRADLFGIDSLRDFPELAGPLSEALYGADERTWLSFEAGFEGIHSMSELEKRFSTDPDLADMRDAGSTLEDWISDMSRMGIVEPVGAGPYHGAAECPGASITLFSAADYRDVASWERKVLGDTLPHHRAVNDGTLLAIGDDREEALSYELMAADDRLDEIAPGGGVMARWDGSSEMFASMQELHEAMGSQGLAISSITDRAGDLVIAYDSAGGSRDVTCRALTRAQVQEVEALGASEAPLEELTARSDELWGRLQKLEMFEGYYGAPGALRTGTPERNHDAVRSAPPAAREWSVPAPYADLDLGFER